MRTNIEIDNSLMEKARRLDKSKTKKEIVDLALRTYIKVNERKKLLNLFGKIEWEGDLNQMRKAK
ncbi:MAG: type II toxin-antitoxin system VapB family antitoxin [Ignavibacteria bacterium]|nr:type II toxin-antitoxin system VapB family antitoxin [Ignavibacteria bacterium]